MAKDFQLSITSALALSLVTAACGTPDYEQYADRDTAICVDRNGNRVPDNRCSSSYHGGGGFYPYYMSRGTALPYYGDNVRSERFRNTGSFRPASGRSYFRAPAATSITRSVAVSRGGFGSSARSGFSVSS